MSTSARVVAFLAGLVAAFAAALGVGHAVGPLGDAVPSTHDTHAAEGEGPGSDATTDAGAPGGLAVSQGGYALDLAQTEVEPGRSVPVRFTITGPGGSPVTAYDVQHEKLLHLIAVRRDLTGFQHVHPTLSDDGTWSAALDLTPGQWRLFADFKPGGADPLTLGSDLAVPGSYRPGTPTGQTRTAQVGGYTVSLAGDLTPGREATLTLSVTRDGRPVTDLEPYLGAYGHLVALRAGDLAYLHVHPDGAPGDGSTPAGPEVVFHTAVPSAGSYHLYLDFRHRGTVRTVSFAVPATSDDTGHDDTGHDDTGHDDTGHDD